MMYFITIGILALAWDLYILHKYPHDDYTVSEFVYKFVHKYPIAAVGIGMLVIFYFPSDIKPIIAGILIGHFTWKA